MSKKHKIKGYPLQKAIFDDFLQNWTGFYSTFLMKNQDSCFCASWLNFRKKGDKSGLITP